MGVGEGGGWGRGRGGQELTFFFPIYVWGPLDMLDGAPLIFAHQARANLIGSKFEHSGCTKLNGNAFLVEK